MQRCIWHLTQLTLSWEVKLTSILMKLTHIVVKNLRYITPVVDQSHVLLKNNVNWKIWSFSTENLCIDTKSCHRLGNFWVVKTDYLNYALIYGCNQLRDDGRCHRRHELVYLISRTPDLSSRIMLEVEQTIQNTLCVNINQLLVSTHEGTILPSSNLFQHTKSETVGH